MFLVGILLLLCSAWWPCELGFLSIVGCGWCCWFDAKTWQQGAWCFVLLWCGYLYWLPLFFYQKAEIPASISIGMSFVFLLWIIFIINSLWFVCWRFGSFFATILTFYVSLFFSTPFLTINRGVPLLNPFLPALTFIYPYFCSSIQPYTWTILREGNYVYSVYYIPPATHSFRSEHVQKTYKTLCAIPPCPLNINNFIVSPESFFPYPLRPDDIVLSMWRSGIPPQSNYIFGGSFNHKEKLSQALFCINKSPITHLYEKEKGVDFFEYIPSIFWQKILWGSDFSPTHFFTSEIIKEEGGWHCDWQPLLCSDLVWKGPSPEKRRVMACLNETWLPLWLQELWFAYGVWYALKYRKSTVLVGHQKCIYTPVFFCYDAPIFDF